MSGATQNRPIVGFKRCHANAVLPERKYNSDAAYDVCAVEGCIIPPGAVTPVKTGLLLATCDANFHPQLCSRSGLAMNAGVIVVGGIVDSGYRGEIVVAVLNTGQTSFTVHAGDRIAQMRFVRIEHPRIAWMDLAPADRGDNGFGSTGVRNKTPDLVAK